MSIEEPEQQDEREGKPGKKKEEGNNKNADETQERDREADARAGKDGGARRRTARFRDMVFTRQFSAFDRQNELSASSPFQGFYVLFWIAVALLIVKMAADNWRRTGNPLGTNELLRYMFARDGTPSPRGSVEGSHPPPSPISPYFTTSPPFPLVFSLLTYGYERALTCAGKWFSSCSPTA